MTFGDFHHFFRIEVSKMGLKINEKSTRDRGVIPVKMSSFSTSKNGCSGVIHHNLSSKHFTARSSRRERNDVK